MTNTPLYRIEEYSTVGWEQIDDLTGLTKEQAQEKLNILTVQEGLNPGRLRVIREK